jgi:hypothetical protein
VTEPMAASDYLNQQQFFHGTRHTLEPGQMMEGGVHPSNQGFGTPLPHVYFSASHDVAAHFGDMGTHQAERKVYRVEPVGKHEADPYAEPEEQAFRARKVRVLGEA